MMSGRSGGSGLRYASLVVNTSAGGTGTAATVNLPVATKPKTLRVSGNTAGFVQVKIDNTNFISAPIQPNGAPTEVTIPSGAFPEPVTSVIALWSVPALAGGSTNIEIGY